MNRQTAPADIAGKSVTITRNSPITGKAITRTAVIEGPWTSYNGTAVGMPVILANGLDRHEVLSPAEQDTIR
jgi:hypothetical protein